MAVLLSKDMQTDPSGAFLGLGSTHFPWLNQQIEILTKRPLAGEPINSRRYWTLPRTFTGIGAEDLNFTFKFIPRNYASNNGYLRIGFYGGNVSNDYNFFGLETFRDTSTIPNLLFFLRGRTPTGTQFTVGPYSVPASTLWDVELRIEFTQPFPGMPQYRIEIFNQATNEMLFRLEYVFVGWENLSCDTFALSGRAGLIGAPAYYRADLKSFEVFDSSVPPPTIQKVGFFMGVVPT